ncbi:MAG TPA: MFS transporter [Micromonosporaceae bacterium]
MSFASGPSHWRDVRLVAAARAISTCGDFLAATALALALQQAGAGGMAVSGLLVAASLPLAVLAPVAGRIADRVDSRLILVVAGLAQAAVCSTLAYVHRPTLIIALVALLACGLAVTQPTLAALLPAMVRREDLAKAMGINQTAGTIGMLIAPAAAGVLVGQFGTGLPLLIDAGTYLALVAAGLLLRTRRNHGTTRSAAVRERVAWRLRGDRLVATMVIALAAVVGGVGAINVIEVFFIRETLNASTTVFGLINGSWTAGCLIGALLFARVGRGRDNPGRLVRGVLLMLAGTCAMVVAGAGVWTALVLIPLWLVGGVFNGGLNVFTTVVMAHRVPPEARGRAFAVMGSAVQGAGMAGLVLGGVLVDRFDPRLLVAASGAAGLAAVVFCLPAIRRTSGVGSPPARTPACAPRTGVTNVPGVRVRVRDSVGS